MLAGSFKDAPHEEEARLYKMYDTMLWEHLEDTGLIVTSDWVVW